MRTHTSEFKNNVKEFGRELDSIITYEQDGETIELGMEQLNSITPHYEGAILKSVMKQLDIDSNVEIPKDTVLNYQFGVKVRDEEVEDYRDNYDYIDFGNYIVYETEKQEDTNSWKITCYDKMLYSMKDYENLNIAYPITIRDYINTICTHLGLTFANSSDTFANYNRQISGELYLTYDNDTQTYSSMGYTFRDVLDELAQATASTICINNDDELEIRYITETNDTIDEEYLKNINVNFGEQYGAVNTIVLSRSADSDSIYYPSILPENPIEIKISDNQIMNGNNRADYLPDIYAKLNGLQYYINDFSSPGICYYDICDRYTVQIGETYYSCVMLNDEINVTQGLDENIYTNMLDESVTDYTKADKTDRRINQTYLIVDKQNQQIEAVVSQTIDPNNPDSTNNKVARLSLKVDELESEISETIELTVSGESTEGTVSLINVAESQPILIKIHPIINNISYLYPYNGLYPSSTTYLKSRALLFNNTSTSTTFTWTLPTDLWYYDSTHYDELEMAYGDGTNSTIIVTRRCQINADGTISLLAIPTTETYAYPTEEELKLTSGNYTINFADGITGYLYVQLMANNLYTSQFYTKAETNTKISQTADSINATVSLKLDEDEFTHASIVAKINDNTSQVQIDADKVDISANDIINIIAGNTLNLTSKSIAISSTDFSVTPNGVITASNGTIGGWNITAHKLESGENDTYIRLDSNSSVASAIWCGAEDAGDAPFRLYKNGSLKATNATINGTLTSTDGSIGGFTLSGSGFYKNKTSISSNTRGVFLGTNGFNFGDSTYYIKMGSLTNHPEVSGLNVTGSSGINLYNNGISNCTLITSTAGNRITIRSNSSGDEAGRIRMECEAGLSNIDFFSSVANINMLQIYNHIHGGSSIKIKKNIEKINQEEKNKVYDIIKNIDLYSYNYKEEYNSSKDLYHGFMIEDLENTILKDYLHFKQNENDKNIKTFESAELPKLNLLLIKTLIDKIEKLEAKYE